MRRRYKLVSFCADWGSASIPKSPNTRFTRVNDLGTCPAHCPRRDVAPHPNTDYQSDSIDLMGHKGQGSWTVLLHVSEFYRAIEAGVPAAAATVARRYDRNSRDLAASRTYRGAAMPMRHDQQINRTDDSAGWIVDGRRSTSLLATSRQETVQRARTVGRVHRLSVNSPLDGPSRCLIAHAGAILIRPKRRA